MSFGYCFYLIYFYVFNFFALTTLRNVITLKFLIIMEHESLFDLVFSCCTYVIILDSSDGRPYCFT